MQGAWAPCPLTWGVQWKGWKFSSCSDCPRRNCPVRSSWRFLPNRAECEQHLHHSTTISPSQQELCVPVVSTFHQSRQLWEMQRQQRSPSTRWTGDLAPVCVLIPCASGVSWDVTSLGTQAKNSTSVPSSAFPASTPKETGETCSSLGTQPGHALCKSSWPPLKAKGTRPRTPAGNWRCRRAAGAAQLCCGF